MLSKNQFNLKKTVIDFIFFTIGSALISLGLFTFAKNANFAPGGLGGIALIINHYTGAPIGIVSLLLNIPMALVALKMVGGKFIGKSIICVLLNTIMMDIVFPLFPVYSGEPLLAAAFTGLALGAGIALIFMKGGSTGGTDFLILSIRKIKPHQSLGNIMLVFQVVIVALGGLVYESIDAILYGVICAAVTTATMNKILYGSSSGSAVFVITTKSKDVIREIGNVPRGTTVIPGSGGYTGSPQEIVVSFCTKNQVAKVRTAARVGDPSAMIMICDASEIIGNGFMPASLP